MSNDTSPRSHQEQEPLAAVIHTHKEEDTILHPCFASTSMNPVHGIYVVENKEMEESSETKDESVAPALSPLPPLRPPVDFQNAVWKLSRLVKEIDRVQRYYERLQQAKKQNLKVREDPARGLLSGLKVCEAFHKLLRSEPKYAHLADDLCVSFVPGLPEIKCGNGTVGAGLVAEYLQGLGPKGLAEGETILIFDMGTKKIQASLYGLQEGIAVELEKVCWNLDVETRKAEHASPNSLKYPGFKPVGSIGYDFEVVKKAMLSFMADVIEALKDKYSFNKMTPRAFITGKLRDFYESRLNHAREWEAGAQGIRAALGEGVESRQVAEMFLSTVQSALYDVKPMKKQFLEQADVWLQDVAVHCREIEDHLIFTQNTKWLHDSHVKPTKPENNNAAAGEKNTTDGPEAKEQEAKGQYRETKMLKTLYLNQRMLMLTTVQEIYQRYTLLSKQRALVAVEEQIRDHLAKAEEAEIFACGMRERCRYLKQICQEMQGKKGEETRTMHDTLQDAAKFLDYMATEARECASEIAGDMNRLFDEMSKAVQMYLKTKDPNAGFRKQPFLGQKRLFSSHRGFCWQIREATSVGWILPQDNEFHWENVASIQHMAAMTAKKLMPPGTVSAASFGIGGGTAQFGGKSFLSAKTAGMGFNVGMADKDELLLDTLPQLVVSRLQAPMMPGGPRYLDVLMENFEALKNPVISVKSGLTLNFQTLKRFLIFLHCGMAALDHYYPLESDDDIWRRCKKAKVPCLPHCGCSSAVPE